jgi:CRP/FNR family cyclic AMP-dependent transcriptional regulator
MSHSSAGLQERTVDPLDHLPVAGISVYAKGQLIYGPDRPSDNIFLVVSGNVGISQVAEDGREVLLEVVRPDSLFGESAFLSASRRTGRAIALEKVNVMTWPISEIEELVTKRPLLAVALMQVLARRNAEYTRRIEILALDNTERRLARSLINLSELLGTREESGAVLMMPFTHQMLAQYIGTKREAVSLYMSQFRIRGCMSYSRRGIRIYGSALEALIRSSAAATREPAHTGPSSNPITAHAQANGREGILDIEISRPLPEH